MCGALDRKGCRGCGEVAYDICSQLVRAAHATPHLSLSGLFVAPRRQSSIPSLSTCFGEVESFLVRSSCMRDKVAVGEHQVVVVELLVLVRDIDTRHSLIRHRSVTGIEFKIIPQYIPQYTLYPIAWPGARYSQTGEKGMVIRSGSNTFTIAVLWNNH